MTKNRKPLKMSRGEITFSESRRKWGALFHVDSMPIHLGFYNTEREATDMLIQTKREWRTRYDKKDRSTQRLGRTANQ